MATFYEKVPHFSFSVKEIKSIRTQLILEIDKSVSLQERENPCFPSILKRNDHFSFTGHLLISERQTSESCYNRQVISRTSSVSSMHKLFSPIGFLKVKTVKSEKQPSPVVFKKITVSKRKLKFPLEKDSTGSLSNFRTDGKGKAKSRSQANKEELLSKQRKNHQRTALRYFRQFAKQRKMKFEALEKKNDEEKENQEEIKIKIEIEKEKSNLSPRKSKTKSKKGSLEGGKAEEERQPSEERVEVSNSPKAICLPIPKKFELDQKRILRQKSPQKSPHPQNVQKQKPAQDNLKNRRKTLRNTNFSDVFKNISQIPISKSPLSQPLQTAPVHHFSDNSSPFFKFKTQPTSLQLHPMSCSKKITRANNKSVRKEEEDMQHRLKRIKKQEKLSFLKKSNEQSKQQASEKEMKKSMASCKLARVTAKKLRNENFGLHNVISKKADGGIYNMNPINRNATAGQIKNQESLASSLTKSFEMLNLTPNNASVVN